MKVALLFAAALILIGLRVWQGARRDERRAAGLGITLAELDALERERRLLKRRRRRFQWNSPEERVAIEARSEEVDRLLDGRAS